MPPHKSNIPTLGTWIAGTAPWFHCDSCTEKFTAHLTEIEGIEKFWAFDDSVEEYILWNKIYCCGECVVQGLAEMLAAGIAATQ